ncbi:hypothetical protein [Pseudoalteromonas rhizosphaerae]|uniref:hypothetical protein n=1 Tax=Pseudoalteromonas rhizosphaerae TaxID=2518973 RepID=UPI002148C1C6|nr:hypothetical protein [Pseudoalteromonas rhizosphaerae]
MSKRTKNNPVFWYVTILLGIFAVVVFFFFIRFSFNLETPINNWVDTASYFNGILTPPLLAITSILIFLTWKTSKLELKETRKILDKQLDLISTQNLTIDRPFLYQIFRGKLQRFDNILNSTYDCDSFIELYIWVNENRLVEIEWLKDEYLNKNSYVNSIDWQDWVSYLADIYIKNKMHEFTYLELLSCTLFDLDDIKLKDEKDVVAIDKIIKVRELEIAISQNTETGVFLDLIHQYRLIKDLISSCNDVELKRLYDDEMDFVVRKNIQNRMDHLISIKTGSDVTMLTSQKI